MNASQNVGKEVSSNHARKEVYELSQFFPTGDLGMGAIGVVKKVIKKDSNEIFAMKVMEKRKVVERGLQEQLHREVLTQSRLRHENIVLLHYHFEDKLRIYCLLEYADKGQLFSYLRDQVGGLPEQRAGFFFWDTLQALHYLHCLSIMHRDIKPENILLFGSELIAKLGDFGWCAKSSLEADRTTFCGTLDYIPPEMLVEEPHNVAVDLWALGVLLYEMLIAKAPFAASSQKLACDLICAIKFVIPADSMSVGAEQVIRGLLVRNARERWPTGQIVCHPWVVKHGRISDKSPRNGTNTTSTPSVMSLAPANSTSTPSVMSLNTSKAGYNSVVESVDPLEATIIMPRQVVAPIVPPRKNEEAENVSTSVPNGNCQDRERNNKIDESLVSPAQVDSVFRSSDIFDLDLLGSVPDSRIELDDLDNLWNDVGTTSSITSAYARKQAEKEFGLDGTRRRTAVARSLSDDKVEVTTWRGAHASGDLPAMTGTAPRPKMRSRRTKELG